MDTEDLTSYYPGYEDRDNEAKVPYEDYARLEEELEIYKKVVSEIKEVVENEEYFLKDKAKFIRAILADMREELCE